MPASMLDFSISPQQLDAAAEFLAQEGLCSPLIQYEECGEIFLKCENLLPTGSFKIRAASWALQNYQSEIQGEGVWTASAGNMGRALAWRAKKKGIPCTIIVPHDAPTIKTQAMERYGARLISVPFEAYQQVQVKNLHPGMRGKLIHPFADRAVITANAVIGREVLEQAGEVDALFIPYGGGGLTCGVAQAVKMFKPEIKIIACEVETAAPLTASLKAGKPENVVYRASFVSGMGAPFVFPQMWPWVKKVVDETSVVSLAEVAEGIKQLAVCQHVVVEGAGAVSLAAALKNRHRFRKIVCILSGGNIDLDVFRRALDGTLSE
ncbi:MAG: threonine ammonia-lyase [Chloroflexota bacterium]